MKKFATLYILVALLPGIVTAQEPVVVDTVLFMSDGIALQALYVMPATPPPPTGYPGILSVHGFSGSKDQVRDDAIEYAKRGYAATAYSVRAQGGSGGTFDFFNSERILDDLRAAIAFTKDLPDVNDDRIGVIGGSQGGLHAWAASCYDLGVRAVISMISNGRFLDNWTQNNAMNFTFAALMANTPVKLAPNIRSTVQTAIQTNDIGPVKTMLAPFSTTGLEQDATAPTLMIFSYYDQYFNPSAGLRQFHNIEAPKRAITYPGTHWLSNNPIITAQIVLAGAEWFEYWLKDDQQYAHVLDPGCALTMYDGADNTIHHFAATDTAIWLETDVNETGIRPVRLFFGNSNLQDSMPADEVELPFDYIGGLGGNATILRSEPLAEDMLLVGSTAYVQLFSSGTAARYQANVELRDFDPDAQQSQPISRGHYQQNDNTPGDRNFWRFYLNAMMHTVRKGHQIEVRVHGGHPAVFNPANNDVVATGRTSENTIYSGGQAASLIQIFTYDTTTTSTGGVASPATPHLAQNYPNPFGTGSVSGAEVTFIEYITATAAASLDVYNSMGQKIATLHAAGTAPGEHTATFSANGLTAGVYFAVLRDGNVRDIMPMVVVR